MRAALILLAACGGGSSTDSGEILLFSRTTGYRHADAIEASLPVLRDRFDSAVESEDAAALEDLSDTRVVVFLYTTGDVATEAGRAELERFVRAGGGFVGIHSATDTEYEWPFYQELVVAPFASHPAIQPASIDVVSDHVVMNGVPMRWDAEDEWYNFKRDPSEVGGVEVLANLDETTFDGGAMGASHPIIWLHERLGGRAVYSAIGHVAARWHDPTYVDHVVAAITWAAN